MQYDESSANSPSGGGMSPRSSETKTGQQIRPTETSFDNGQSGGVHPSANDKKPSNIQVELE